MNVKIARDPQHSLTGVDCIKKVLEQLDLLEPKFLELGLGIATESDFSTAAIKH
jgi:hypothetical protein